ncbi:MAG: hypothetical protein ABI832_04155 [bacterium]
MRDFLHNGLCTLLSAALMLAPLPILADAATTWQVPGPDTASQPLPDRIDPTQLPDLHAAALRAVGLLDGYLLTEPTLDEQVLALGLDPRAAFALLRDTVQSQRYGGQLRDPQQVLLARSGNAYDKAAALAELLGRMGYDTRLVTSPRPQPLPAPACVARYDPDAWRLTGLGPSVLARIHVRAEASYGALRPLLAPVAAPLPDPEPHVWLQMRDGANWVDLDPWLPDTAWGAHPAGDGMPLSDQPAAQAVTLTLSLEQLRDGQLQREDLLSNRFEMPQANGWLIALVFGPRINGVGGSVAQVMAELEGGTGGLVANLLVNGDIITSAPFTAPGTGEGVSGFLSEPDALVTTGLWLTLTSTAPGMADHSVTRAVLDLVPADLRASGSAIDPADLLPVARRDHMALGLQGIRQIALSNGGTSHQVIAANKALQMDDAPDVLIRALHDNADPWDGIWGSYLEAGRVALAAETLMRAKPGHDGACLMIDRPRALIWGLSRAEDGGQIRWLDWALDDVSVQGGDATAQAEQMLWHGAVQAAVEKEALYYMAQGQTDAYALETGPLQPFDDTPGALQDQALGYVTMAGGGVPADMWWRVDPATGRSDARLADFGNGAWGGFLRPGSGGLQGGMARVTDISRSVAQLERDAALRARLGPEEFRRVMQARRQAQAAEAALERQRATLNEYLMLAKIVMGIALAVGAAVLLHDAVGLATADEVVGGSP